MSDIKQLAVIGSGVMGSGIAALAANAGISVALLDIVPDGAPDRSTLAKCGIAKQLATGGFVHPDRAKLVTCGNLQDDLSLLANADWIVEAVVEKLPIKQQVYRTIDSVRKPNAVISSNTSTLPLHTLLEGLSEGFAAHFMIAHFFNPPRHMRLLEVVKSKTMKEETFKAVCDFADIMLGKEVVNCKDTPGFIANRIGVYWMTLALNEALKLNIDVALADRVMGKALGFPKTGVFGLYDLIGLDLMPLIAKAMHDTLPKDDPFLSLQAEPPLLTKLISEGYTGRKGKGGFYRIRKENDKKIKEVLELASGDYRAEHTEFAEASAKAKDAKTLLSADDIGGQFACNVMFKTLHYAASLIPEINDDIASVDAAMRTGYSWKWGPFELIDAIGVEAVSQGWEALELSISAIIKAAQGKSLYAVENQKRSAMALSGNYTPIRIPEGVLLLEDIKLSKKSIYSNASAKLWDIGDGIACLEITTKMHSIDDGVFDAMESSLSMVKAGFKGLVIGSDAAYFSAGFNLAYAADRIKAGDFASIEAVIARGQEVYTALQQAPFPIISALAGFALGGGCELLLHSNGIQAFMESTPGLVEVNVGLIPAWGGCKEMLRRKGPALALETILQAKTATSALAARELHILREGDCISMNSARVLADAKQRCLELGKNFTPHVPATIAMPANTPEMLRALIGIQSVGMPPHQREIAHVLIDVLSTGAAKGTATEAEILKREREGFMQLVKTPQTLARIEHMLATGKPLMN